MIKPTHSAAAMALLVLIAGAGDAQARAIYTGTFDPRGPVYGFSGTYSFAVDPACLATNGWKSVNGLGDCGEVFLIGGSLTLRKYAAPGLDENAARAIPDVTFDFSQAQNDWNPNLQWGPESGQIGAMQDYIDSIYVVNNKLYGVDTPARFGAFGMFDGLYWGLQFTSGGVPDVERAVTLLVNCEAPFTPNEAVCAGPNAPGVNPDDFIIPASTNVTITEVPEPGSLALVAGALLAAGFAGRRVRRD